MTNYFVVFNEQLSGQQMPVGSESQSGAKTLDVPKIAKVIKVETTTVPKAQQLAQQLFQGDVVDTPVVVTEAQWKTS